MQDADLEIKNESVLVSAVNMVDALPLIQSDVKGDIYEYFSVNSPRQASMVSSVHRAILLMR
jgi:hypothetical protein